MHSRDKAHLYFSGRALLLLAALAAMPLACKPNDSQPPAAATPAAAGIPGHITGQAVLDQLLGEWTYECVSKAGNGPEKRETGRVSYTRILGGRFVQETDEGADNTHGLRLFTYDDQQKCYLTWFFSRYVQTDEATLGQWDETNQTLNWTRLPGKGSMMQHRFLNRERLTGIALVNDEAGITVWKGDFTFARVQDSNKPDPVNIASSGPPPEQSPEQKVLDRLLGTWHQETTQFKALWNPQEKHTTGTYTFVRILDGSFVQETGTDAEGNSELILYAYDQQRKCYRIWNFGSSYGGPQVPVTGTWNEAALAIELSGPKDAEPAYSGQFRFVDDNAVVSTFVMHNRAGEVLMNMEFRMTRIDGNPQAANAQSGNGPVVSTIYRLVSIDGQPVPCSPAHEGQQVPEVSGGSMIINDDGTFRGDIRFTDPRVVGPGGTPGTYTREGNTLTMKHPGAGYTEGTMDGDKFTMNNEGMLFVYQK